MADESGVITHPKFRMWLRPDGILHLAWAPKTTMTFEDALAAIEAMAQLAGGRRSPLMVDVRDAGQIDRPARNEFVRRADMVSAVALLVDTPLSRMMANLYLRVSSPTAATRLFEDEASALAWLLKSAG
jgi:hypothetical protein